MILRSLTKHVKDQNWFAVGLDFFIVVAGILLAFQITNWSELRGEKSAFARAEIAITGDLIDNYINAKTRLALSECRKLALRNLGEQILQPEEDWEPAPNASPNSDLPAFSQVLRSPKRYWKVRIWETELARGSFDLMELDRRQDIDLIFTAVRAMAVFQGDLENNESRLEILGQANELSRAERYKLFEIVSVIDGQSVAMEQIGQNIVDGIEALDLKLNETERDALRAEVADLNERRPAVYGECSAPIVTRFLDDLDNGEKL